MFRMKWILTSSLVFGISAGLLKAIFFPYPEYNPPAIYPAVLAALLSAVLWGFIPRIESTPLLIIWGGTAGAVVGLLTPILMWPVFLFILALSEHKFPETFFWSPIYMINSLFQASLPASVLGFFLGRILIKLQLKAWPVSEG